MKVYFLFARGGCVSLSESINADKVRGCLRGQRAVFVSTAFSQPRHQRRARMLLDAGMNVRVYAFGRGLYSSNTHASGVELVDFGSLESGRYVRRLPTLLRTAMLIRSMEAKEKFTPAFQYVFGLDSALIASLAFDRTVPLVYEVGDIRNQDPRASIISRAIYALERRIVNTATVIVVTTSAFIEQYFSHMAPGVTKKSLVIKNRLPSAFVDMADRTPGRPLARPIRIGFVGLFRYAKSLLPLVDAVSDRVGAYELHLFGDGPLRDALQTRARNAQNVFYHGPFKNPDDLKDIYDFIDINYVVYDNSELNVRLAIPNKLYESIYFGKPMVVAAKTQLAEWVRKLDIGFVVDPGQKGFAGEFLDGLCFTRLRKCASNALTLPTSYAIQDDEQTLAELSRLLGH